MQNYESDLYQIKKDLVEYLWTEEKLDYIGEILQNDYGTNLLVLDKRLKCVFNTTSDSFIKRLSTISLEKEIAFFCNEDYLVYLYHLDDCDIYYCAYTLGQSVIYETRGMLDFDLLLFFQKLITSYFRLMYCPQKQYNDDVSRFDTCFKINYESLSKLSVLYHIMQGKTELAFAKTRHHNQKVYYYCKREDFDVPLIEEYCSKHNLNCAVAPLETDKVDYYELLDHLIEIGKNKSPDDIIYDFADYRLELFMYQVQSTSFWYYFVHESIISLMNYDTLHHTDYYDNLYAYLTNNKDLLKTSGLLGLHRNTLDYRIKKIESILKIDLDDCETCFELLFSYHLLKFKENFAGGIYE